MTTMLIPQRNTIQGSFSAEHVAEIKNIFAENNGKISVTVDGIVIDLTMANTTGKFGINKSFPVINNNRMNQVKGTKMFGSGYHFCDIFDNGAINCPATEPSWVVRTFVELLNLDYTRAGGYRAFTAEE